MSSGACGRAALLAPALALLATCSSAPVPVPPPHLEEAPALPPPEEIALSRVKRIDDRKLPPCVWLEPTASRREIAYVDEDDLVVMLRDSERRFSLSAAYAPAACRHGSGSGHIRTITPDGKKAVLLAITRNTFKNPDLYHPIIEVECLVDLESGTAAPLSTALGEPSFLKIDLLKEAGLGGLFVTPAPPRVFLWHSRADHGALEVHDPAARRSAFLAIQRMDPICHVALIDGQITLACVNERPLDRAPRHTLDLVRFDPAAWPPRTISETSIPLREIHDWIGLKPSPDGRLLAYWGPTPRRVPEGGYLSSGEENVIAVLDLSSGTELFSNTTTLRGSITAAEIDVQGRGVLVGDDHHMPDRREGRLRYFSLRGERLAAFRLPFPPRQLHLLESRDRFVATGAGTCDAGYFAVDLPDPGAP